MLIQARTCRFRLVVSVQARGVSPGSWCQSCLVPAPGPVSLSLAICTRHSTILYTRHCTIPRCSTAPPHCYMTNTWYDTTNMTHLTVLRVGPCDGGTVIPRSCVLVLRSVRLGVLVLRSVRLGVLVLESVRPGTLVLESVRPGTLVLESVMLSIRQVDHAQYPSSRSCSVSVTRHDRFMTGLTDVGLF